jgi:hypothetical protein
MAPWNCLRTEALKTGFSAGFSQVHNESAAVVGWAQLSNIDDHVVDPGVTNVLRLILNRT